MLVAHVERIGSPVRPAGLGEVNVRIDEARRDPHPAPVQNRHTRRNRAVASAIDLSAAQPDRFEVSLEQGAGGGDVGVAGRGSPLNPTGEKKSDNQDRGNTSHFFLLCWREDILRRKTLSITAGTRLGPSTRSTGCHQQPVGTARGDREDVRASCGWIPGGNGGDSCVRDSLLVLR